MSEGARALHDEAMARIAAREWDAAGRAFARLADALTAEGNADGARNSWENAGECWRRADLPVAAARALRTVLADPDVPGGPVARLKLAGVYVEVGEMALAEASCRRVLAETDDPAVAALAADTAIGVLEARGRKEEARALLPLLPDGDVRRAAARAFREAQIARLDGRFGDARRDLARVEAALTGVEGADGGLAAVRGERAEVALLEGAFAEALAEYAASTAEHEAAGRVSMRWRGEAGRVRASVEAGVEALASLDVGVSWALDRGMRPLVVDLRIARGMARASRDPAGAAADLDAAVAEADALGLPLKAGRARLERATRVPGVGTARIALLEQAIVDLVDAVPLAARARVALEALRGA